MEYALSLVSMDKGRRKIINYLTTALVGRYVAKPLECDVTWARRVSYPSSYPAVSGWNWW